MFEKEEFAVIIQSLGETTKSWLRSTDASGFWLTPDADDLSVRIDICMGADGWDARDRVLTKMVEVHSLFVDELSLSYGFCEDPGCSKVESASGRVFATV